MTVEWTSGDLTGEPTILAGDVGGTNTSIAYMTQEGDSFRMLLRCVLATDELGGIQEAIDAAQAEAAREPKLGSPEVCCFTAAGPVHDNVCRLTNVDWDIDGNELSEALGIPTVVINDFTGISYGIPLLDVRNPERILPLPQPDGTLPAQRGTRKAVVGAGTGLGVGHVSFEHGRYVAFPSEGGHSDFAPFDDETRGMHQFLQEHVGAQPDAEALISGPGISRIFQYVVSTGDSGTADEAVRRIQDTPEDDRPRLISEAADSSPACMRVMDLFVRLYGRFAGTMALTFLPEAGLYLAGGIVTKNERLFLEDSRFMTSFTRHPNAKMQRLLRRIPVYVIRDYTVSLYGAANGARSLLR
jgi:glucokinase